MRRTLSLALASTALACFAAETGSGSGGSPDSIKKSDPAPHPQAAGEGDKQPAAATDGGGVAAVAGNAAGADPNAPTNRKDAEKQGKRLVIVWVQPGHETFGIGQIMSVPGDEGERLRAAGRARYASPAEVKAAGDKIPQVTGI